MADTGGLTSTLENPTTEDADEENLIHIICRACEDRALKEGKKVPSMCGILRDHWATKNWPEPGEGCIVCFDLLRIPCPRCKGAKG